MKYSIYEMDNLSDNHYITYIKIEVRSKIERARNCLKWSINLHYDNK